MYTTYSIFIVVKEDIMKRLHIGLIVVGIFILFYYILPQIFYALGVESVLLYAFLKFFSFILVPVFMYKAFEFIPDVKYIAIAFFLVSLAFLLAELSYYEFTPFLNVSNINRNKREFCRNCLLHYSRRSFRK